MGQGESLSKHLYDAGGGVKRASVSVNNDTTPVTIATPAAGKKIIILWLVVMPKAAGANGLVDLSFWSGANEDVIFVDLTNQVVNPISLNVSSCPIIGADDAILKGICAGDSANPAQVTVGYVEV